ncbi:hypothetical protein [Nostoc sp. MG11]|nr:hypothetical protein [Nostoc sp. MG11]
MNEQVQMLEKAASNFAALDEKIVFIGGATIFHLRLKMLDGSNYFSP